MMANSGKSRRLIIYLIAGLYLLYLAYGLLFPAEGSPTVYALVSGIVIGIFGAFFTCYSVYHYYIAPKDEDEAPDADAEEESRANETDPQV